MTRKIENDRELVIQTNELYKKHPEFYLHDPFYSDSYKLGTNYFVF